MNHPEATQAALSILRKGNGFQWYVITMLIFVIYIYANEIERKNWKGVAAGMALYMIHWFVEIVNALIQHFSGHALWTVPGGTALLLLVGVGVELSLMFSVAGLASSKMLLPDPKAKILGINNRWFIGIANAALASILEVFLVKTPVFVWVYRWWGAIPVFVTVYIPFFVVANLCYDWKPRTQKWFIGMLAGINVLSLVVFAGILRWI